MITLTVTQPEISVPITTLYGDPVIVTMGGIAQVNIGLIGIQGPPGEGGGGSNAPATVGGTANALALSGLTVGAAAMTVTFVPIANNTGAATATINGGAAIPILSRLGVALVGDELLLGVPVMAILTPGVSLQLIVS
jgi:hypothetical protein